MTQDPQNPQSSPSSNLPDDLIVVPKETSRTTYLLVLGLMLFVLVIFTVGDQVQNVLGGGGGGAARGQEVVLTWVDPVSGEKHETTAQGLLDAKRELNILMNAGLWSPADPAATRARLEDEDVLLYQVLDQLAEDSGIEVSDEEFVGTFRAFQFTDQTIQNLAQSMRMDSREVKRILRDGLRPTKMLGRLLSTSAAYADPAAVEAAWKEDNPEFSFQYIELNRADYIDQAKANGPTDEELQAWLDEQPPFQQQRYASEVKVRAEVAWIPVPGDFDATALLEKYPAAEGTDADARAELYYNTARATRFRTPPPAEDESEDAEGADGEAAAEDAADGDAADGDADDAKDAEDAEDAEDAAAENPEDAPQKLFYDLDEVREEARKEAMIWDAMTAFLDDVRVRTQALAEGETLDWSAEAKALGLQVETMAEPLARGAFAEVEGWGGTSIGAQLSFQQEGAFLNRAIVEKGALVVARVVEKVDPERKPWEEIKDEVLTQWAEGEAIDLAVDSLNGILESCATRDVDEAGEPVAFEQWTPEVDEQVLRENSGLANFTLVQVPHRGRYEWPNDDANQATPFDRFVRGQNDIFELEPGQVAYARKDFKGESAYLVRLKDKRDPDPKVKLKAQAVLDLRQRLQTESITELRDALYPASEWFQRTFQVEWALGDDAEEETAPAAE